MGTHVNKDKEFVLNVSYTSRFRVFSSTTNLVLIWLTAGSAAFYLALLWLPAIHIDGQYIPAGADSFYHARRILDLVLHGHYFQFDTKVHAPEGSLLTWPWAYDYLIAQLVVTIQFVFGISDPMAVLTYIPPAWVFVNVAILLGITSALKFAMPMRLVAALCFICLPLTQYLHGAGRIDHHFMEHTMVLLALYTGIKWFQNKAGIKSSVVFGLALGLAPGVNNGLFVLQIPILLTLLVLWFHNSLPNRKSTITFAATLIGSTCLLLIPSQAFREGMSSYYYLSWFHLYVSCSSAVIIYYISTRAFSKKSCIYLVLGCFLLIAGIVPQLISGSRFLLADIQTYKNIPETYSLFKNIATSGLMSTLGSYTFLVLIAPFIIAFNFYRIFKDRSDHLLYFIIFSAFGYILLILQFRLHYFGSYALYLPLLLLVNEFIKGGNSAKIAWFFILIFFPLCYLPVAKQFTKPIPVGRSFDYALTRQIYPAINSLCNSAPGVILADYNDGNYIRFHSDCSVIANNMVITPKDVEKVLLTAELMEKSATELVAEFPWIDYVYVKRNDNIMINQHNSAILKANKGLRDELLLRGNNFPKGFNLVKQLLFKQANGNITPFARLFKIDHSKN